MTKPNLTPDATWKQRFTVPNFYTQIAHKNPDRGLVISDKNGVYQLYAWDIPSGEQRPLTHEPAGVTFGGISPDGEYIYYHQDTGGDELGKWVRVPFTGDVSSPRQDIAPNLPNYYSNSLSQSLDNAVIGFTVATHEGFKIYTVSADAIPAEPVLIHQSHHLTYGPILSYDAKYAVIGTTEGSKNRDFSAVVFDIQDADNPPLIMHDDDSSLRPLAFAPLAGDARILCTTDSSGYDRPLIWDITTGSRTDIPLSALEGSVTPQGWFPDGKRLLLSHLDQAIHHLYIYDLEHSTLTRLNHPSGTFSNSYVIQDDEIITHWEDATHPIYAVILDNTTGAIKRTLLASGDAPAGRPWRSVTFKSSGDVAIQAWLCTPETEPQGLIIHMHGGPTTVTTETYKPDAQTWVDHGFAWMSVNYRGSTTFGREFEAAIWGMLGHREVDDIVSAYHWAVDNSITPPHRVFLTGASYGGYLTLQTLGKAPELWAGGMAEVAIADWTLMYQDMADTLKGYHRSLWGGTPDEHPEAHRRGSPLTYVEDVQAPLIVMQALNDTRCPAYQMQVYEQAMQEAGKDITVHWFDAGHGRTQQANKIRTMELFLAWMSERLAR